jgi:predicted nuclease with TOPRIM domain
MNRELEREVFGYCAETCPQVEGAFADVWDDLKPLIAPTLQDEAERMFDGLLDKVKEVGTEKLREALRRAVDDKRDVERERDDLQKQVNDLKQQVDDLQHDVGTLEHELAGVSA